MKKYFYTVANLKKGKNSKEITVINILLAIFPKPDFSLPNTMKKRFYTAVTKNNRKNE
jgi:CO dehydrogenase/acetyl-CoA synthase epsilon subunit